VKLGLNVTKNTTQKLIGGSVTTGSDITVKYIYIDYNLRLAIEDEVSSDIKKNLYWGNLDECDYYIRLERKKESCIFECWHELTYKFVTYEPGIDLREIAMDLYRSYIKSNRVEKTLAQKKRDTLLAIDDDF